MKEEIVKRAGQRLVKDMQKGRDKTKISIRAWNEHSNENRAK